MSAIGYVAAGWLLTAAVLGAYALRNAARLRALRQTLCNWRDG